MGTSGSMQLLLWVRWGERAIPYLVKALEDGDMDVQWKAVTALEKLEILQLNPL